MFLLSGGTAPFPTEIFKNYSEFKDYLDTSESERTTRWLYERSLATEDKSLVIRGTCGLCLTPTYFASSTSRGEAAPRGIVPNWRENLVCGCKRRLINRQRALLHFLAAGEYLNRWTRVLLLGEAGELQSPIVAVAPLARVSKVSLESLRDRTDPGLSRHHLVVSAEQLSSRLAQASTFTTLFNMLTSGGTVVFSAPFDVHSNRNAPDDDLPINWNAPSILTDVGFHNVRVATYWSEEFGYLGPFNILMAGSRL